MIDIEKNGPIKRLGIEIHLLNFSSINCYICLAKKKKSFHNRHYFRLRFCFCKKISVKKHVSTFYLFLQESYTSELGCVIYCVTACSASCHYQRRVRPCGLCSGELRSFLCVWEGPEPNSCSYAIRKHLSAFLLTFSSILGLSGDGSVTGRYSNNGAGRGSFL